MFMAFTTMTILMTSQFMLSGIKLKRREQMLTKTEVEQAGYTVLPKGGWIHIDPEVMPRDWNDICKDFDIDPSAKGAYFCVVGVKQESWDEGDDDA
jgi:hypothetical protein